ncbi:MAG: M20/M25/M40 family metallo-hydrolase [Fibromonadaceae bacterium]|nr:M20/M25/M40 family metallo-hydrolase [Fibromonadaceae bacterium]
MQKQIETELNAIFESQVKILEDLVKIPSISFEGFDPSNIKKCADAVFELFKENNFDEVRFLGKQTNPAVFAELKGNPNLPSVLLYAHYDVQPPMRENLWLSPAFEPQVRDGRLYGRGTADDKAAIVVHLAAALIAKKMLGEDCPAIKFLIEGEEECGSPNITALLKECKNLKSSVAIICDSSNWNEVTPAIVSSLRGMVALEIEVKSMEKPLHSGTWSGPIPDVAQGLSHILASLKLPKAPPLAKNILESFTEMSKSYGYKELKKEGSLLNKTQILVKEKDILKSLWRDATITVTAMEAGSRKNAGNVLQNSAWARVSIRIPPGMDIKKVLEQIKKQIKDACPWGLNLSIKTESGMATPWETKTEHIFFKKMLNALKEGYGKKPLITGCGASIPMVAAISKAFKGMPVLLTGIGDPKANAHGENESVSLAVLKKAILSEILFLHSISSHHARTN